MRIRVGVILIADNKIALIKRVKAGKTYFVIPGGGIEEKEHTDEAAVREAKEELGVDVSIERLVFVVERLEHNRVMYLQFYYLATIEDGIFGTGEGEEFSRSTDRGTYEAVWLPIDELNQHQCYPSEVTDYLQENGVPKHIEYMRGNYNYPS